VRQQRNTGQRSAAQTRASHLRDRVDDGRHWESHCTVHRDARIVLPRRSNNVVPRLLHGQRAVGVLRDCAERIQPHLNALDLAVEQHGEKHRLVAHRRRFCSTARVSPSRRRERRHAPAACSSRCARDALDLLTAVVCRPDSSTLNSLASAPRTVQLFMRPLPHDPLVEHSARNTSRITFRSARATCSSTLYTLRTHSATISMAAAGTELAPQRVPHWPDKPAQKVRLEVMPQRNQRRQRCAVVLDSLTRERHGKIYRTDASAKRNRVQAARAPRVSRTACTATKRSERTTGRGLRSADTYLSVGAESVACTICHSASRSECPRE
jgi:hypothetical protein